MVKRPPIGHVYLIVELPEMRFCKIGFSEDVDRRLKDLQGASPRELAVSSMFVGTQNDEGKLHQAFSQFRVRGEWFTHVALIEEAFFSIRHSVEDALGETLNGRTEEQYCREERALLTRRNTVRNGIRGALSLLKVRSADEYEDYPQWTWKFGDEFAL